MVKKYKIKYLPIFYKDLDKILNYIVIRLKNELVANNLLNEIYEEIHKRALNPECYEKYLSYRKRKEQYYRIYVKNYIIFYVVTNEYMEIRRILYNRRNYNKMI